MEVGVRLTGILLRLLHWMLLPIFWIYNRGEKRSLPSITNPLLLESAISLAKKIRNGEVTSELVVSAFINRITEVNPLINAVVEERFDAALEDARKVDLRLAELRKNGGIYTIEKTQPFLGVPFTVKESCSLAGLSNSVGCVEVVDRKATFDGGAVRKVKEAGGIPLLVSNTPELCLGWETSNLLNGTTNNPYNLTKTPGGSSGGEAALIASAASVFGVASDIAGSIRIPSAFAGVFGHKPTPGIIPIDGHIPTLNDENYSKFLTTGPIVRKAEDLIPLLKVMAGQNSQKLRLDEEVDMKRIKVLYMTEATHSPALLTVDNCIKTKIQDAVNYLQKCGVFVSEEKFTDMDDSVEMSVSIFFSMKDIPNMLYDSTNPKKNKSLVVEFFKYLIGISTRSLQGLGFALIHKTQLFIPESRRSHYNLKATQLREQIMNTLGDNGVFLYPVFSGQAHYHNQIFPKASGVMYTMMFNILGMPATAVPLGLHNGLPVSIQVIAAPNQDRLCLAVAKQLEAGFGGWKPPA